MTLSKSAKPRVTVYVGYEWAAKGSVYDDAHWNRLRDLIRRAAPRTVDVRPRRIRGTHGQDLLATIHRRIENADVLVFDITGFRKSSFNFNVVLEAGVAIGCGKLQKRRMFILAGPGIKPGSDLAGLLYSKYGLRKGEIVMADDAGFRSALAAAIRASARDKKLL